MNNKLFEIRDRTKRIIYLTNEKWKHITAPTSPHAYMTNFLEEVKQTLISPHKIISDNSKDNKVNYYKYYKENRKYLE